MQTGNRKSAPRVIKGAVQKKNNWAYSPDYYYGVIEPRMVAIDRKRPGAGYRHVLSVADVRTFLELLPEWETLAVGLNAVVLVPGEWNTDGYHAPGVVHVCAWEADLWRETTTEHYEQHRAIWDRLEVRVEPITNGAYNCLCKWEESQVRAYQLLHILLHELGHHHDRITTRSKKRTGRGEVYAENYAFVHEALIWNDYHRVFGGK